jgi:hypothetical protein
VLTSWPTISRPPRRSSSCAPAPGPSASLLVAPRGHRGRLSLKSSLFELPGPARRTVRPGRLPPAHHARPSVRPYAPRRHGWARGFLPPDPYAATWANVGACVPPSCPSGRPSWPVHPNCGSLPLSRRRPPGGWVRALSLSRPSARFSGPFASRRPPGRSCSRRSWVGGRSAAVLAPFVPVPLSFASSVGAPAGWAGWAGRLVRRPAARRLSPVFGSPSSPWPLSPHCNGPGQVDRAPLRGRTRTKSWSALG